MIVVTGAGGFIGSALISRINNETSDDVIAVDRFNKPEKYRNVAGLKTRQLVDKDAFFTWIDENHTGIRFIFHIGARTDTREADTALLSELNTEYTKRVWDKCCAYQIPLVYASSAATYGNGEQGFLDDELILPLLKPQNAYAVSKHDFDLWALQQKEKPPFWAGLKFFNVYGPNEYHKSHMASVVFHGYNQLITSNRISLFKSYKDGFSHGGQMRDFIYVKDVTSICTYFLRNHSRSGIYNVGTGVARTFLDLAKCLCASLRLKERIDFVEMPGVYQENYQYYTVSHNQKLSEAGYSQELYSLESGIEEYVGKYLRGSKLITHS